MYTAWYMYTITFPPTSFLPQLSFLTIIEPVVYMARYVMVLRRATSLTRVIGRDGP